MLLRGGRWLLSRVPGTQIAHAKVAKGIIFNFGFLMFSRIRGTRLRVVAAPTRVGVETRTRVLSAGVPGETAPTQVLR